MNLDLGRITEQLQQSNFVQNFIKELEKALENFNNKDIENIKLSPEEDMQFYRQETNFLRDFFNKELSDTSRGEVFLVTDKYENDPEYHRYKVSQYKDNFVSKSVVFEKDLPENVQLNDIVRKIDGKYVYDAEATQYVNDARNEIKQNILNSRNKK